MFTLIILAVLVVLFSTKMLFTKKTITPISCPIIVELRPESYIPMQTNCATTMLRMHDERIYAHSRYMMAMEYGDHNEGDLRLAYQIARNKCDLLSHFSKVHGIKFNVRHPSDPRFVYSNWLK